MNKDALAFEELGFSAAFCDRCRVMGYSCMQEIFDEAPGNIFRRKGFTYIWFTELAEYLKANNLTAKLQPIPGNTAG